MQTPQTLTPGKVQLQLGGQFEGSGITELAGNVLPSLDLGVRVGLAKGLDMRLRSSLMTAGRSGSSVANELFLKGELISAPQRKGFALSWSAGLGHRWLTAGGTDAHIALATAMLIGGYWINPSHQLILTPRIGVGIAASPGASTLVPLNTGVSLGWLWRLNRYVAIQLEVGGGYSPTAVEGHTGTFAFHGGVGISLSF